MTTSKKKKISALLLGFNTGRTFIWMNDSSRSNRWQRAERHSEKHQILMQFFLSSFSRDRHFYFLSLSPFYIYEQCNDVQEGKKSLIFLMFYFIVLNCRYHQSHCRHRDLNLNGCLFEVMDFVVVVLLLQRYVMAFFQSLLLLVGNQ
jgi:hypothetical protein